MHRQTATDQIDNIRKSATVGLSSRDSAQGTGGLAPMAMMNKVISNRSTSNPNTNDPPKKSILMSAIQG